MSLLSVSVMRDQASNLFLTSTVAREIIRITLRNFYEYGILCRIFNIKYLKQMCEIFWKLITSVWDYHDYMNIVQKSQRCLNSYEYILCVM